MNNLTKPNRALPANDPWRDFFDLESFFPSDLMKSSRSFPAVNISEDEKGFNLELIAPGFKKEDLKINVEDDILTISAETKTESSDNGGDNKHYSRREYSYNAFTRSFKLPDNAKDDAISANYSEGILKLNIPKSKQQTRATKQITIK